MLECNPTSLLLASNDSALVATLGPAFAATRFPVKIVLSIEAALEAMTQPYGLVLLDELLPADRFGMNMTMLLAVVNSNARDHSCPILLITDTVTGEWANRLAEGVIDDVIPRSTGAAYILLRVELALRAHSSLHELELLRQASALNEHRDSVSGVYSRATLISMLFRETDRVQRMKTSLCLMRFDIDNCEIANSQLSVVAPCDNIVCQVVERTMRLLRSYDLLGRIGKNEFLLALPGCDSVNAMMQAERLNTDVFANPFRVAAKHIRLSACFGIAPSNGRSPLVVLQDVERALQNAKRNGPGSVESLGTSAETDEDPAAFLSSALQEQSMAW